MTFSVNLPPSDHLYKTLNQVHAKAPDSKFCKDGLMMVNRPKHFVKIKIKLHVIHVTIIVNKLQTCEIFQPDYERCTVSIFV